MSSLKRDLFERRLWPLAVVIVAAIVAVPFLLHGQRAGAVIPAPPAAKQAPNTSASGTHARHSSVRHHATPTSRSRDPFATASVSKASGHSTTTSTTSAKTSPSGSSTASPGSSGRGSNLGASGSPASSSSAQTTTPVTPPPATTPPVTTPVQPTSGTGSQRAAPKTTSWDIYSVDLRVGAPGGPVAHRNLARLTPLPSERSPQAMYMGVADHGRAAVFALGAGVEVRRLGAGRSAGAFCHPSHVDCALVVLPAGKSVALVYVSATGNDRALVLRVTRIGSRITHSEPIVRAARRHVSAVGLCDLKLGDPIGFFNLSDDSVIVPSTGACRHDKLAVPFPGSLGAGSSVRG